MKRNKSIAIIICANAEWHAIKPFLNSKKANDTPFGESFIKLQDNLRIIYLYSGYGKIPAAAATQYLIDQHKCDAIINLGTCGGFGLDSYVGQIILANQTINYDIIERMGDYQEALDHFSCTINNSKLSTATKALISEQVIVSADQDIDPQQINFLMTKFKAKVADWESASIAYVCTLNHIPVFIVRGVSDLVNDTSGEAYETPQLFEDRAQSIMSDLWSIHLKILSDLSSVL